MALKQRKKSLWFLWLGLGFLGGTVFGSTETGGNFATKLQFWKKKSE